MEVSAIPDFADFELQKWKGILSDSSSSFGKVLLISYETSFGGWFSLEIQINIKLLESQSAMKKIYSLPYTTLIYMEDGG